jgi:hypothetical protein
VNDTSTPCEDWETIFGGGAPGGPAFTCDNFGVGGTATAVACFSERTTPNASIFTGGGSKDQIDIPQWLGKDGSVPDKDNIVTAFAARYTVGANTILYFGADRFSNNGDAQIGFWFFQNAVTFCGVSPLPEGCTPADAAAGRFLGTHKDGDILILSNFKGGGDETNIQALQVANYNPADGSFIFTPLTATVSGDTFSCNQADTICAATNCPARDARGNCTGTDISLDPLFKDKGNTTPQGRYAPVEFFEGGLNLSAFGLGGECFASFLVETRASTSLDSVLKDFVLQNFEACEASVTTDVHDASDNVIGTGMAGVAVGTAVHDKATVTGQTGVAAPQGTVTFSFFDNGTCAGDPVEPLACEINVLLSEVLGTTPPSAAVDNSACTRTPGVGLHAYRAHYNGQDPFPAADGPCEPFEILRVASAIDTDIVLDGGPPFTVITDTLIDLSTNASVAVQDKATVTCTGGNIPTGTVTFTRYSNGDCTGTPTEDKCDGSGCPLDSSGIALSTPFDLGANAISYTANYIPDANSPCTGTLGTQCEPVCAIRKLRP